MWWLLWQLFPISRYRSSFGGYLNGERTLSVRALETIFENMGIESNISN